MSNILIQYHPVKKEVHFLSDSNGSFNEVNYFDSPFLEKYSPKKDSEFLLQNAGNDFFDDISNAFLLFDDTEISFKGTKLDYEDFVLMVENYNSYLKNKGKKRELKLGRFYELTPVDEIFTAIKKVYEEATVIFDKELPSGRIKDIYYERNKLVQEKIRLLEENSVNICMVGTYSAGKSAFINALIGERILPENIRPETAKMFRVQHADEPSINFKIKKDHSDSSLSCCKIAWDKKNERFTVDDSINDGNKGKIEELCRASEGHPRSVQVLKILEMINNMPAGYKEDDVNYIEGLVDIKYPIDMDADVRFSFYDTPGTDSNSFEHIRVLRDALSRQTNSILIVLYEPIKMDGKGNSVLYSLMKEYQKEDVNEKCIAIDLARSLHVINQVDKYTKDQLIDLMSKPIHVSKSDNDILDESEVSEYEYTLSDKRVFFVSSKAAYCSKALQKNLCDSADEEFLEDNYEKIIRKTYYQYDKMANAEYDTVRLKNESQKEMDDNTDDRPKLLYISSGMFAIENEIRKYAKKYALAVKAKSLYDSVTYMIEGVESEYKEIERLKRKKAEELQKQIKDAREGLLADIKKIYQDYTNPNNNMLKVSRLDDLQRKNTNAYNRALKEIKKLPKFAFNESTIKEKNRTIVSVLNELLTEENEYYLEIRADVLKDQLNSFKEKVKATIKKYKDLDEDIINGLLTVSDSRIPDSKIQGGSINDFINSEKFLLFITTTDKDEYVKAMDNRFRAQNGRQYNNYLEEINEVALDKINNLYTQYKNNVDSISEIIENLSKDRDKVRAEQEIAEKCINIVDGKMNDLNTKIWRCINE